MTVNLAIASRIKQLLKDKKMTRYKLEKISGISHSTLKNILHEKVKDSQVLTIILIAKGFGLTISEFLNCEFFNNF